MRLPARSRIFVAAVAALTFGSLGIGAAAPALADDGLLSFTTTPTPTIQSAPEVDGFATAEVGQFEPTPDTVTYAWFAGDDQLTCNTAQCFVNQNQFGDQLTVAVTATKAGYTSVTETSAPVTVLGRILAPTMTLTGIPKPGDQLTVDMSKWPTDEGYNFSYQWIYAGDLNTTGDVPIVGEVAQTHTVTDADSGKYLGVEVDVTRDGYQPLTAYSSGITADYETAHTTQPVIYGLADVGQRLSTLVPFWLPEPDGGVFQYQWYSGGSAIPGATASDYTVQPSDVGTTIDVTASADLPGFGVTTTTSDLTAVVPSQFDKDPLPVIKGTPELGQTLTADISKWSPAPSQVTYTWTVLGSSGVAYTATGRTFAPTTADLVGDTVTLTVTASDGDRGDITETSAPTAPIAEGVVNLAQIRFNAIHLNVPVTYKDWPTEVDAPITAEWTVDGGTRYPNNDYASVIPEGSDYGKRVSVVLTLDAPGWKSAHVTISGKVGEGYLDLGHTTMSGVFRVGQTLTVSSYGWGPTGAKVSYAWQSSSPNSPPFVAHGQTYTLRSSDLGHTIVGLSTASLTHFRNPGWLGPDPIRVSAGIFSAAPVTSVTGTNVVGATLTAQHSAATPSAAVTYHYQWYGQNSVGGALVKISGATSARYRVGAKESGLILSVRVTASKKAYTSVASWSAPIAAGDTATQGASARRSLV